MEMNNVVGIIRDDSGNLEDLIQRGPSDFTYKTELDETVVYSFFQEFEAVSSSRDLFIPMLASLTEKMLTAGISVKGFIFTKNKVVVICEDECTAYITDWPRPDAGSAEKILVSAASRDDDDGGGDDGSDEYEDYENDGGGFEDEGDYEEGSEPEAGQDCESEQERH